METIEGKKQAWKRPLRTPNAPRMRPIVGGGSARPGMPRCNPPFEWGLCVFDEGGVNARSLDGEFGGDGRVEGVERKSGWRALMEMESSARRV